MIKKNFLKNLFSIWFALPLHKLFSSITCKVHIHFRLICSGISTSFSKSPLAEYIKKYFSTKNIHSFYPYFYQFIPRLIYLWAMNLHTSRCSPLAIDNSCECFFSLPWVTSTISAPISTNLSLNSFWYSRETMAETVSVLPLPQDRTVLSLVTDVWIEQKYWIYILCMNISNIILQKYLCKDMINNFSTCRSIRLFLSGKNLRSLEVSTGGEITFGLCSSLITE